MARQNRRQVKHSETPFGRRRQARRASVFVEVLEQRRMLAGIQPYVFNSLGIGGTGTDYFATINPSNPAEMYDETDMGGVWHTTNGGLTWTTLNMMTQIRSHANACDVQFTNNPQIQYAVCTLNGVGGGPELYETTNDGTTWFEPSGWAALNDNNGLNVQADPNQPGRLIVLTTNGNSTGGTGAGVLDWIDVPITECGAGYTSAPSVSITGGSGSGATAISLMDVTGYSSLAGGTGYNSSFNVSFSGGGGTGAAATATASSGVITSITFTNYGSGYTSDPTISFTAGGGSGASATATMSVNVVEITNPGNNGYTSAPKATLIGGLGTGGTAASTKTYTSGNGGDWTYNIYYSNDGGLTFSKFASGGGPSDDNESYAAGAFFDPNGNNVYFATSEGLWTTSNASASGTNVAWTQITGTVSNPNPSSGALYSGDTSGYYSLTGSDQGGTTRLWGITESQQAYQGGIPTPADNIIYGSLYEGVFTMSFPTSTGIGSTKWTNEDYSATTNSGSVWGNTTYLGPTQFFYPKEVGMVNNNTGSIYVGGDDDYAAMAGSNYYQSAIYSGSATGTNVTWTKLMDNGRDTVNFPNNVGDPINGNVYTRYIGENGLWGWGAGVPVTFVVDPTPSATGVVMDFTTQGSLFETVNGGTTWYDIAGGGPETPTTTLPNGEVFETPSGTNYSGTNGVAGTTLDPFFSNTQADGPEFNDLGVYNATTNPYGQQPNLFYGTSSMNETSGWMLSFPTPSAIFNADTDFTAQFSSNDGASWEQPFFANNASANSYYDVQFDPANGMMYAVTSNTHDMYVSWNSDSSVDVGGGMFVVQSSNDGSSWSSAVGSTYESDGVTLISNTSHALPDDAPAKAIILDPENQNIAYVGTANNAPVPTIETNTITGAGIWETTNLLAGASAKWVYLGQGSGASVTATWSSGTQKVTGFTGLVGGSGYGTTATMTVLFTGGGGSGASATATVSGGVVTNVALVSGGSGYTSAPTVSLLSFDQPMRDRGNGVLAFSALHPEQFSFVQDANYATDGNTDPGHLMLVSVFVLDGSGDSTNLETNVAGIWVGIPTSTGGFASASGTGITWQDRSSEDGTGNDINSNGDSVDPAGSSGYYKGYGMDAANPGEVNMLPSNMFNLTVDPNDPTQNTWFAVAYAGDGGNTTGFIYKSTNQGKSWTQWSMVGSNIGANEGSGDALWIQPGGTAMLFGSSNTGLYYTANYQTNSPVFTWVGNFPFQRATSIVSNPWNPDQIWFTTFGDGMYEVDLTQIGAAAIPQNLTATAISSTSSTGSAEVQLTWTADSPAGNSYAVETSTNGGATWTAPGASPVIDNTATVGGVGAIFPDNYGTGYGTNTTVVFTGGGGNGAAGTVSLSNDVITSIPVNSGGTGYTAAPTVGITGGGGAGAEGVAILSNGVVSSISIANDGSGYTSSPTISIGAPGGSGTQATLGAAVISNGVISGITITSPGYGYTSAPAISFSNTGGGTGATAGAYLANQNTSYILTGLANDTAYSFRMVSYDAAGYSQPSADASCTTYGVADPGVTKEEFALNTGATLNGTGSGTGWVGNWTSGTNATIVGPLTLTNPPASAGNALQLKSGADASRTLNSTVATNGNVLWASFEENSAAGAAMLFGNTTNGIGFGTPQYSIDAGFVTYTNGSAAYFSSGNADVTTGSPNFLVARMDFEGGMVNATLYLNPTPGLLYPDAGSIVNLAGAVTSFANPLSAGASLITLTAPNSTTSDFDELRLGNTYADVTPPVTALGLPASMSGLTATPAVASTANNGTLTPTSAFNEIDLSWNNGAQTNPQQGEIIQQSGGGSGWTTIAKTYDPNAIITSYAVTNLSAGTAYKFEVESYNLGSNSGIQTSAEDVSSSATTAIAPPAAAPTITSLVANQADFSLAWSAVSGATDYVVQYTDNSRWSADNNQMAYTSGGTTYAGWVSETTTAGTSMNITLPEANTVYYFRVIPYNSGGNGYSSTVASAFSLGAPTNVSAVAIASTQAIVSWTDTLTGFTGYDVEYSSNGGSTWSASQTAAISADALTVVGLTANTSYIFQVQAYEGTSSYGVWSTPSAAITTFANSTNDPLVYEGFDYPYISGSTTDMNGQSGGGGTVGWSGAWGTPAGNTYAVGSSTEQNSLVASIDSNFTNSASVANNLLTTGSNFYSVNRGGLTRSLNSALPSSTGTTLWASVLVQDDNGTDANGYIELNGTTSGDHNVYFGYFSNNTFSVGVSGETHYVTAGSGPTSGDTYLLVLEIIYGTSSSLNMWVDPDPTKSITGVTPQVTTGNFSWALNPINSVTIIGSPSNSTANDYWDELRIGNTFASVTPNKPVIVTTPNVPTNVVAAASTSAQSVALSWAESSTGSIDYNIERSTTSGSGYTTLISGVTTTSYTDTSVSPNTPYYYKVDAYYSSTNPSSWSSNSNQALTIPAAPTGLAANPGTSTIALTWVGNTNESSFTIQRSTDDATWGNLITGVSKTATGYTDTTPASGVVYYYRIDAVNTTGGSSYDDLPSDCGVATVYAYEGFNYPTASSWNGAGATGIGFSGNWTIANSTHAGIVSGLGYTSGSSVLTAQGNALSLTTVDTAIETLAQSVGATGTTLWVGFEFSTSGTTAELDLGSSTNEVRLGAVFNGDVDAKALVNGTTYFLDTTVSVASNTTYFEVYKITFNTGGDVITMYNDPTPGPNAPGSPTGTPLTLPSSAQLSTTNNLTLWSNVSGNTGTFDEVRLGSSYGSVAPDPKLLSGGSSAVAPRRTSRPARRTPFFAASVHTATGAGDSDFGVWAAALDYRPSPNANNSDSSANLPLDWNDNLILGSAGQGSSWLGAFNN